MVPVAVTVGMNTMKRNNRRERENRVIMQIRMSWGHCCQCSRRFLLEWALVLRGASMIKSMKRDLIMESPIVQSIERRNMSMSGNVLVHHLGVEGTIEVVGIETVRIPSDWIS